MGKLKSEIEAENEALKIENESLLAEINGISKRFSEQDELRKRDLCEAMNMTFETYDAPFTSQTKKGKTWTEVFVAIGHLMGKAARVDRAEYIENEEASMQFRIAMARVTGEDSITKL